MAAPHSHRLLHSAAVHPVDARRLVTAFDTDERVRITVVVRSKVSRNDRRKAAKSLAAKAPTQRQHLGPAEFVQRYGSTQEDLRAVSDWAKTHDLETIESSSGRRCVVLEGRIRDIDEAFGIESGQYECATGLYRSHEDDVHLPRDLKNIVQAVLGIDNRAHMVSHASPAKPGFTKRATVMDEYAFPKEADGSGQCIGIIGLSGGFHAEDLKEFLGDRKVAVVELDGQTNDPSAPDFIRWAWQEQKKAMEDGTVPPLPKTDQEKAQARQLRWTLELTSDIQNAAAFAPGSDIVIYFAPCTIQGKYTAFTTALIDENAPSVLSCSWGGHEDQFPHNNIYALDDALEYAALRGVTLCFSSGDDGDGSTFPGGEIGAHFPACSPHVLACGGTMEQDDQEVVWDEKMFTVRMASGGGVSQRFGSPWWQPTELVSRRADGRIGRGIPDVAGMADMARGYRIRVGGVDMPVGGTSSVAPMWAALIARLNQQLGAPMGYVTPLLYLYRDRFEDATCSITKGNNGIYEAVEGWDACTGWGTPRGDRLLKALEAAG